LKQVYYIIGHDAMSKGLEKYFSKNKWQNTLLPDFIGALNDAIVESNQVSLKGFNFNQWCDTWLKSSGVNIITALYERNEDGTLKNLKIKQTCEIRGQN